MTAILGIDAAWTCGEPSGVALIRQIGQGWSCLAAAPSYDEFLKQAAGTRTRWSGGRFAGCSPNIGELLRAAQLLCGCPVSLIAIDMPVARAPFRSRRPADDAVSTEFGSRWCSTHTPSASRPGAFGETVRGAIEAAGFTLSTNGGVPTLPSLIEVFPHVGLLSLLRRERRVPYKVSKSTKYWPGTDVRFRINKLLDEFIHIHASLHARFDELGFELPKRDDVRSLASLKCYEDVLDALICAWLGVEHLAGRTVALGDETAAIWCPKDIVRDSAGGSSSHDVVVG